MEKTYERVSREALWQVLRMYDVGGNLLNGMYVNSLACIRVKGGEKECFRINSGVRQGCMDAVRGMGRRGVRFQEEGKKRRLPGLLYADNLGCVGRWRKT